MAPVTSGAAPAATAPSQALFLFGSAGEGVQAARISANGQAMSPATPTDILTGVTGFPTGAGGALVGATAPDPKGRFLYAAAEATSSFGNAIGSNAISEFAINRSTGALVTITGSPALLSFRPTDAVVDGTGRFLYVAGGGNITVYSINQGTGALTQASASPEVGPNSRLAASWDGRFIFEVGGGNAATYSLDQVSGQLTQMSTVGVQNSGGEPFLSYSGKFLYTVGSNGATVLSIDAAGKLTVKQSSFAISTGGATNPNPLVSTTRDDSVAFVGSSDAGSNAGRIQAYNVDPATGAIGSAVGSPTTFASGQSIGQVTLDYSGKFLYVLVGGMPLQTFPVNGTSLGSAVPASGPVSGVEFFRLMS